VVGASMAGGAGAIGAGVLGLLLADSASASITSSAEEDVTFDRGCHGYGHGGPGHFFSYQAPGIPLTHRPNGWDAADPIAESARLLPDRSWPYPGQGPDLAPSAGWRYWPRTGRWRGLAVEVSYSWSKSGTGTGRWASSGGTRAP
jgi:hypothetical protein